ncbi:hypothetical protein [Saccharospirillum alexandrii]|uniref:hypothetical protein n=1 Tax=Saccharospirillum alexandrii TaxID=2448477 RepID=UPI0037360472
MDLNSIASAATAAGVLIATWQIWQSRKLAGASFEDSYDQQYRELMYRVPVDALLGKKLNGDSHKEAREAIYNYLDLCNEQVYQRSKRRVSKARWAEWKSGIKDNLEKSLISGIWCEVKSNVPGSFSFLERLEQSEFESDPVRW